MRKLALMLLSLLAVLAFSLPVFAQEDTPGEEQGEAEMGSMCGPGCKMGGKTGGMMGGMMGMHGDIDRMTWPPMNKSCRTPDFYIMNREELGLSGYQVEALAKLNSALKKEMVLKGAAVKVLEMELSDIVTMADFKLDDAQAKLKEIEKARTELRSAVLKASADARDALGPEQVEKLKEMVTSAPMGACCKPVRPAKRPDKEGMKQKMMEKMRQEMMQ